MPTFQVWSFDPSNPEEPPLIDAILNSRYRIKKHLSGGSFGHGWLARDTLQGGTEVFIKIFRAEHDFKGPRGTGGNEEAQRHNDLLNKRWQCFEEMQATRRMVSEKLFQEEVQGLVAIKFVTAENAPGTIQLMREGNKLGLSGPLHFIVNDLCQYELHDWLVQFSNFSPTTARFLFKQLLLGCSHLHNHGYAHNDISIKNVLIARREDPEKFELKLSDFTTVSRMRTGVVNIRAEMRSANAWCAPEMKDPKVSEYLGAQADLFSCGVILMWMVANPYTDGMKARLDHRWDQAVPRNRERGNKAPWEYSWVADELEEDRSWSNTFFSRWQKDYDSDNKAGLSAELQDVLERLLRKESKQRPTAEALLAEKWFGLSDLNEEAIATHEVCMWCKCEHAYVPVL